MRLSVMRRSRRLLRRGLATRLGWGLFLGVLLGGVAMALIVGTATAKTITGTKRADLLRGTKGRDVIKGLEGPDRLFGYRGDDRLVGGFGADMLVGGPGRDVLAGGPGNDRINAKDGRQDVVSCGTGRDTVIRDAVDLVARDCGSASPPPVQPPPRPDRTIVLHNKPFLCVGHVDLDLVKVTMTLEASAVDAMRFHTNCTGRIGRIEIETWQADGVKVAWESPHPHDITVESGRIVCHGHEDPAIHQDGVHVMGGERITFRNLDIDCDGEGNAQFFVQDHRTGNPTDILLLDSRLHANGDLNGNPADVKSKSLAIEESLRSGARNTRICPGRWFYSVYETGAVQPVGSRHGSNRANLAGNKMVPLSDPICAPPRR